MFTITGFCIVCDKNIVLKINDYQLDDTLMSYKCPKGHKIHDVGCEFLPG